jgi:Ca2+-binding RTX toxin-like protein
MSKTRGISAAAGGVLIALLAAAGPAAHAAPAPVFCAGLKATIVGNNADNVIHGTAGPDVIHALDGNDVVHGAGRNDVICGGSGNDVLFGNAGNDRLYGQTGNDVVIGGLGNDRFHGGTGVDQANFTGSPAAVKASLLAGSATGEGSDTLIAMENLKGSPFNDVLIGNHGPNSIGGGSGGVSGHDRLYGLGGNDIMAGGDGNDLLVAGAGNDQLAGNTGQDRLYGQDGVDVLQGGLGNDLFHGGNGIDYATFAGSPAAVKASLLAGNATGEGSDTLVALENLKGSPFNDVLIGNHGPNLIGGGSGPASGNDRLYGLGGNDGLAGGEGNDRLAGGAGNDSLSGGPGDDRLFGEAGNDSLNGGLGNNDLADGGAGADVCVESEFVVNC